MNVHVTTSETKPVYRNPAWYGRLEQEVHRALLTMIEHGKTYDEAVDQANLYLNSLSLRFNRDTKSVESTI